MYHNQCLSKNKKKVTHFQMKIVIFTGVKNRCMLHGRVFVMKDQTKINFYGCVSTIVIGCNTVLLQNRSYLFFPFL